MFIVVDFFFLLLCLLVAFGRGKTIGFVFLQRQLLSHTQPWLFYFLVLFFLLLCLLLLIFFYCCVYWSRLGVVKKLDLYICNATDTPLLQVILERYIGAISTHLYFELLEPLCPLLKRFSWRLRGVSELVPRCFCRAFLELLVKVYHNEG